MRDDVENMMRYVDDMMIPFFLLEYVYTNL